MKIATLYNSNYRQVAETLRKIADEIDANTYGEVSCAGLVLLGARTECFAMGPDSDAPSVALLFQAGIHKMAKAIAEKGLS